MKRRVAYVVATRRSFFVSVGLLAGIEWFSLLVSLGNQ